MDSEIVTKFLSSMADTLKEAKDFSLQQLPIVAKEILSYNMAKDIVWLIIAMLFLGGSLALIRPVNEAVKKDLEYGPSWLLPISMFIVGSTMLITNGLDVLKIWLAPRVYLLEYITYLLKHH
jgi:hypothetical protein